MKKLILILSLMLISFNVMAEWTYVVSGTNSDTYVDFSTQKINGNLKKVWTKTIYNTPTKGGDLAAKVQSEYDCKNDVSRNLYFVFYTDVEMSNVSTTFNNTDKTWKPVVPDSIEEEILKTVCKKR